MAKYFVLTATLIITFLKHEVVGFPEVIGDAEFKRQVFDALHLLQERASGVINFVNRYVKRIESFEKSGMCVWCKPPTYQLNPMPSNMERFWLAGTMGHDACHSWLYQLNKRKLKGAEPDYESYSGFDAERTCNAYQLKALYRLNAPPEVIDWMKKQDGTHCDLNHDGKCDDEDYKLRAYSERVVKKEDIKPRDPLDRSADYEDIPEQAPS